MKRRRSIVAVTALMLLAPIRTQASSVSEQQPPLHVTYHVISRQLGPIDVAGLKWVAKRPRSIILAIHGSAGVKENNWGPLSTQGYSFAHRRLKEGRTVVAIDLPGYGKSGGDNPDKDLAAVEDYAHVVDQIADMLRMENPKVVGVGHSMGGLIVEVAQGLFRSFDAIVTAGWSHGGYSETDKNNCVNGQPPCADVRTILFSRPYADPKVVEEFVKPLEKFSDLEAINIGVWAGFWTRPTVGPAPDDISNVIDVPVFIILGSDDFFWDHSKLADEPSHFQGSNDVHMLLLPHTGHCVFHHKNHNMVESAVGAWLNARHF